MAYIRDNKGRFAKNEENKKYMHGDLVPETVMPLGNGKKTLAIYEDGSYAIFEGDKEVLYRDLHAVVEDFLNHHQPCTAAAETEDKKEKETENTDDDKETVNTLHIKFKHENLLPVKIVPKLYGENVTYVQYADGSHSIFNHNGDEVLHCTYETKSDENKEKPNFATIMYNSDIDSLSDEIKKNYAESIEKDEEEPEEEHPTLNKKLERHSTGFEQYDSELRQIFDYDNFIICVYQDCTIHIYEKIPSSKYDEGFYLNRIDGDNFTTEKNCYTYMEDFDPLESDEDEECECKCDKCEETECVYHPASKDDSIKSEENASDDNKDDTEPENECNGFAELKSCSGCEDAYSEGYANALENVISMFIDALIDRD